MAEVTMDLDVDCQECGEPLKVDTYKGMILVEPCSKCVEAARREGYDEGLADGSGEYE